MPGPHRPIPDVGCCVGRWAAYYGDLLGGASGIFAYELDGLEYTFRNGLPFPTHEDGAAERHTRQSDPIALFPENVDEAAYLAALPMSA